jgi:drug/metabolite transporter (DMT)-like permease
VKWFLHHTKRVLRITGGVLLLLVGVFFMIPGMPGPGFVLVLAGLSILAVDFVWAHRLKTHLKDRSDNMVAKMKRRFKKDTPPGKH